LKIKGTCTNPHVSATLTDEGGNVLDQKDFAFTTSESSKDTNSIGSKSLLLILVLLILIVILGFYLRRKKNQDIKI
jgi:LPXTG-motif cell wall-anchored protein